MRAVETEKVETSNEERSGRATAPRFANGETEAQGTSWTMSGVLRGGGGAAI